MRSLSETIPWPWYWAIIFSTDRGLKKRLRAAASKEKGATVFGYYVDDPERFGIVEFDEDGKGCFH